MRLISGGTTARAEINPAILRSRPERANAPARGGVTSGADFGAMQKRFRRERVRGLGRSRGASYRVAWERPEARAAAVHQEKGPPERPADPSSGPDRSGVGGSGDREWLA